MKLFSKIFFFTIINFSILTNLMGDTPYYIDFKFVLNESVAGKKAQSDLKTELEKGLNKLSSTQKSLQEDEKKLIQQKKSITPEEYKKKLVELRSKVDKLQKERKKIMDKIASRRAQAKSQLLKNVNPLIEQYMKEKNIKMVIDKRSILLASKELDITKEITKLLDGKLKSINYK